MLKSSCNLLIISTKKKCKNVNRILTFFKNKLTFFTFLIKSIKKV